MSREHHKSAYVFGDSIVNGAASPTGGWPELIRKEFVKEGPGNLNRLYSLGVDGDTSASLLDRTTQEITSRLDGGRLHYFVLSVGLNDTLVNARRDQPQVDPESYKENLKKIVDIFKGFRPSGILLVGITPVVRDQFQFGDTVYSNEAISEYNDIFRNVANNEELPFVDLYTAGHDSDVYIDSLWANDAIHPTSAGQQWIADQVQPKFDKMVE